MRIRFLNLVPDVEKRRTTARNHPRKISPPTSGEAASN